MPQMTNVIIAGVVGLISLVYMAWWWGRFQNERRAKLLATRVAGGEVDLPQQVIADALEYARLLPPTSPEYIDFCRGLTRRAVNDPRVKSHLLRLFSVQRVNAENAASAAQLARMILHTPAHLVKMADIGNACGLMDQVSEMGLLSEEDQLLRARVACTRADVSPAGIQACLRARALTENTPEQAPLTHFLFDYFSTVWDTPDAPEKSDPKFANQAASIFTVMADTPPANPIYRRRAIQSTFEGGNFRTCFEQCDRARDEFGALAMNDELWIIWGQSVVQMEGGNWGEYAHHRFAGLSEDVTWQRLMEVMDRAAYLQPLDLAIQAGRIWTYVGAKVPVKRALTIL